MACESLTCIHCGVVKLYDYARSVAEGTYTQFHFCLYQDDKPTKVWEGVISDEDLFGLLLQGAYIKEEEKIDGR